MSAQKAFIDEIVKWVSMIIPNSTYPKVLRQTLEAMGEDEFEEYVSHLEKTDGIVPIVIPNMVESGISVKRNLDVAKKMGHEFFQHLILTDPITGLTYRTPIKYLVVMLPVRRQQQLLEEKISIPTHNRQVDDLTGQPTGESKGASLTFPETQILRSQEMFLVLRELLKYRGGDIRGFQAMNRAISNRGGVSLAELGEEPTEVKSTKTLRVILLCAHLDNNV